METLVEIVHILVALFMILVVLVQGGNQGGMGAAFGGGSSSGVFGATGATSILGKLTYGAAFVFMLTSITLTIMHGKGGNVGLKEKLKASSSTQAPVTPEASGSPKPAADAVVPASQKAADVAAPAAPAAPAVPAPSGSTPAPEPVSGQGAPVAP